MKPDRSFCRTLPVGPYRLEAGLPGFRTFVQTGIVLQVSGNPVFNIGLEVGQVTEQVEVQADAAMVETRSTGVGQVIDNMRVIELPLNGRNVQELIILSGMAVGGGTQSNQRNYPDRRHFRRRRIEGRLDIHAGRRNA